MPNYQNGKIYKLWSPEGDDIYIGSTTQSLCERKTKHNDNYKRNLTCKSRILFEKYTDVRIELLESCPCDNKDALVIIVLNLHTLVIKYSCSQQG